MVQGLQKKIKWEAKLILNIMSYLYIIGIHAYM